MTPEVNKFVVHTIPGSPYARAVLATLEEKGQFWQLSPLAPGMQRQATHLARHPFGKMPVLEHNGFRLYETQAILRYLDRLIPECPLTPANAREAARMDQAMSINDAYLFQGCASVIVFHRVIGPSLLGTAPDEAAIAEAMPRAGTVIAELTRLLGDQPFFAGANLSLADLMLAPQLDMFSLTPEWRELTAGKPGLTEWLQRIVARPSFQATTWERVAALAANTPP